MGSSVPGVGNLLAQSYMARQTTTTMTIGERSPTATMVAQTTMSTLIPCVCIVQYVRKELLTELETDI